MEPTDGSKASDRVDDQALVPTETFDREQAERVLGRAASMQLAKSNDRVSLAELGQAASEAGIERSLVVRAAAELALQPTASTRRAGMQTRVVQRRWLDRRLDKPTLERMLARLDSFFGAPGERVIHEESASWSARHINVTFEAQGEGTLVQVSEHFVNTANTFASLGMTAGGMVGFLTATVLAKSLLGLGKLSLLVGFPAALITGFIGLWFARRRHARVVERASIDFQEALDSIEGLAAALPPAPPEDSDS
ncbi:MAG: hypothetical protein K0V04_28955 [Deltaproteobacteria bacterium]|nr:hypothetical protein [Deltaproteobacteria bacterium]